MSAVNLEAFTPTAPEAATVSVVNANGQRETVVVTGATTRPLSYGAFQPDLFAVDVALPAAPTGQSSSWQVTGNTAISVFFAAIKGLSWILNSPGFPAASFRVNARGTAEITYPNDRP